MKGKSVLDQYVLISELEEMLLQEYPLTIKSIDQSADKLELGTGLLLLKSIYNHYSSLKYLLELSFVESTGAVLTSLWEKSIMLQYLSLDLTDRTKTYSSHQTFKKLPWSVRQMVEGIAQSEKLSADKKMQDNIDLFYMQYSFLCAIKHGNPYTLTRINRVSENEDFFKPSPKLNTDEQDILGYMWLLAITTFFDGLRSYSKVLCHKEQFAKLDHIDKLITYRYMPNIILNVPQIVHPANNDFSADFWNLLNELQHKKFDH